MLENLRSTVAASPEYDGAQDPETRARMQGQVDFQVRDATAQLFRSALTPIPAGTPREAIAAQPQRIRHYLDGLRASAKIKLSN